MWIFSRGSRIFLVYSIAMFLANLVWVLHLLLVCFLVIVPFVSTDKYILSIHVVLSVGILFHWMLSDDTCALTILECKLRGVENTQSFVHSVVSPVYMFKDSSKVYTILLLGLAGTAGWRAWKIHSSEG